MPPIRLLLIAFFAVLSMSSVPVLIKASAANEITIAIARLMIAVAVFSPLLLFRRHRQTLQLNNILMLVAIGLVFAIHWITYFISIKQATAAIAAMSLCSYGVQYLILARIFNGEKFVFVEWLAVLLCFAGCVVIAPSLSLTNKVTLGVLIGLLSGLAYAVLPLLHQRSQQVPTLIRTWGQFFFALLFFLPFFPMTDWQLSSQDIVGLIVLGVLCTVIGHGAWVKSSTELPALYTSLMYYLYVPIAITTSHIFLGESLETRKIMGAAMILTASIGITLSRYRRMVKASGNAN